MREFDFLIVDFMVEESHKVYCNAIIEEINNKCTSVVIEKDGYIEIKEDDSHKLFQISTKEIVGNYPIKARLNTIYNFLKAYNIAKKYRYRKVLVLGYDPTMFLFMVKELMSMGDIYVVEHHQLDEVCDSDWKRKIWNLYKDKVHHILLDESIVKMVSEEFSLDIDKIHVYPHPCVFKENYKKEEQSSKIEVLCISQSNDVYQIQELIDYEKESYFLKKNNIQIVIRNNSNWDASGLDGFKTIDGYLSSDEYNQLNKECDIVLMPFPLQYRYRCSGTLIDALAAGKKVISSSVPESVVYSELYPELCRTYSSIHEIGNLILKLNDGNNEKIRGNFFEHQKEMKKIGISDICNL